jgi:hypothetical protein
MLYNGRRPSI